METFASSQSAFALELDLESFLGPFDLLLALILREEVELVEVPVAEICLTYLELLEETGEIDLDAATEFLILVAALCELKSRLLLPREDAPDEELSPEEAADELAARLAEYACMQAAAGWLRRRSGEVAPRVFRVGPAPFAPPRPPLRIVAGREDPAQLAQAIGRLLEPPQPVQLAHMPKRLFPVRAMVDRFRTLLQERGTFSFEEAVGGLDRMGQAIAFWAVLELYRRGEVRLGQEESFAPIRIARTSGLLRARAEDEHHLDDRAALADREAVA